MSLSEDPGQQFINEDGTPATWIEPLALGKRRHDFMLFVVPTTLLAVALWGLQARAHTLSWSDAWVGAVVLGLGLLLGAAAYGRKATRRFSQVLVHYTLRQRLARSWGWLLAGAIFEVFLIGNALGFGSSDTPAFFWLLAAIVSPAPIRGLRIFLRRHEMVLTPAAESAKAYFSEGAVRQRQAAAAGPESAAQKRLRYLAALALAGGDVYLWAAAPFGSNHMPAILCGVLALACAGELVGALIALAVGALLIGALFEGIAALPVSVAVVIGAVVIASALRR